MIVQEVQFYPLVVTQYSKTGWRGLHKFFIISWLSKNLTQMQQNDSMLLFRSHKWSSKLHHAVITSQTLHSYLSHALLNFLTRKAGSLLLKYVKQSQSQHIFYTLYGTPRLCFNHPVSYQSKLNFRHKFEILPHSHKYGRRQRSCFCIFFSHNWSCYWNRNIFRIVNS